MIDRRFLTLHAGFAGAAALVLLLPFGSQGVRVLVLVVLYHGLILAAGTPQLRQAWTVLAPFSVLMVLPDWFLCEVLGILFFPDTGGPFIGPVPMAMAGMWTIALIPVVGAGQAAQDHGGYGVAAAAAALAGLAMFTLAELAAPLIGLWQPVGVTTVAGVAIYVVIPEVVLSVGAYLVVTSNGVLPRWATATLTVLLPFTYLGLLATSYQFLG